MSAARRWRVLLLLKPFDVYPPRAAARRPKPENPLPSAPASALPRVANPKVLAYLDDRCRVHKETIEFCHGVLRTKPVDWEPILRDNLSRPIRNVDLVVTVGGDGTLLRASHFMDNSVPVLGVNSDPTQTEEVVNFSNEFDATRSTGYLCAATARNFEQMLDDILQSRKAPSELARISISVNDLLLSTYALNDILVAHPCPATVSRFSFRIKSNGEGASSLVNCRSSGLRVSTASGSTAAMLSAGGFPMSIPCRDLQYMVREPILPRVVDSDLMRGLVKSDQSMHATWYSKEGTIYVDGSHVFHSIQHGDAIEISSKAPILRVYLPQNLSR